MKVLTIHSGHNATVNYSENGKVSDVISEEKFSDIKNDQNFPIQSINYLVQRYQLKAVDKVVCCGNFNQIFTEGQPKILITTEFMRSMRPFKRMIQKAAWRSKLYHIALKKYELLRVKRRLLINQTKYKAYFDSLELLDYEEFRFVDHHTCHGFAAMFSGHIHDEDSLCFTLDGMGDQSCAKVFLKKDGKISIISDTFWHSSPGLIYSSITRYLGMKQLEHEYKVMGLAAYPDEKYWKKLKTEVFKPLIWIDPISFEFKAKIPTHMLDEYFHEKLRYERFDNIAAALQSFLEDLISDWVTIVAKSYPEIPLAFGGGVFMNVKLNKVLNDKFGSGRKLFFMPSAGDESLPIGAAYKTFYDHSIPTVPLENLYLGREFSTDEIIEHLKLYHGDQFDFSQSTNIEQTIAKLLAQHHIVARVCARGEWGARSLGNRAVLANPSTMEAFHFVNNAVKMRDFWMPFAPSILEERAHDYVLGNNIEHAKFMILGFDSTPLGQDHLVAAMHQKDKTIRPQIVNKTSNVKYYKLIKEFEKITGIGGLLNTSYNLHGYPLADSLNSIFSTFKNSELRFLAFENILIQKKD